MRLSIVTPLYRSAPYLKELVRVGQRTARTLTRDVEWILVNDGSPDESLRVALELRRKDYRITVIDLSRNFGHHKALRTGLEYAKGDWVFILDSDLEDRPEWLARFWSTIVREKADVAFGVRARRKGSVFEKVTGGLFYGIFNFLTGLRLPLNITTARLMSRRYVDAFLSHRERELYLGVLMHFIGFKQVPVNVETASKSPSTYDLSRKIDLLINSLTGYTDRLFRWMGYLGFFLFLAGFACAGLVLAGVTPVIAVGAAVPAILMVGGMVIASVGLLGIYLYRVMLEVKGRPAAVVRRVYAGHSRKAG